MNQLTPNHETRPPKTPEQLAELNREYNEAANKALAPIRDGLMPVLVEFERIPSQISMYASGDQLIELQGIIDRLAEKVKTAMYMKSYDMIHPVKAN